MADLLVDTDVLVDHLRGAARLRRADADRLYCSVITRAELFAGAARQEQVVRDLLAGLRGLEVTDEVAEAGGRIRRETGVALADALIAATALAHGLRLLTRNVRDFQLIDGLVLA